MQNTNRKPITILFVDDQPEAIAPLEMVLKNYDCNIVRVSSVFECGILQHLYHADLIVLEWNLGDVNGQQVIDNCCQWAAKIPGLDQRLRSHRPKVVTHSGQSERPRLDGGNSKYFNHVDHWSKTSTFQDLKSKVAATLNVCGF